MADDDRPPLKLHDGEADIDADLVRRLVADQFPRLRDPAADVIAAWSVLGPAGRALFRRALGVEGGTWERARGYALHQAALIIPYYAETNPGFAASARRTVEQVLADAGP
jgi:hypothetical protein